MIIEFSMTRKMKKQVLISAVLMFVLAQACFAQPAETTEKSQNIKRIKELISQRYQLKALLADHERFQALPDAEEKLAEYKKKLERIKNPPAEHIPTEVGKEREEQWKKFKQMHGDKWSKIYGQVRAAVSELVVLEALDTKIEPFCRFYYTGTIEARQHLLRFMDVDPDAEQEQLWQVWKKATVSNEDNIERRLEQLREKYQVPDAVVEHAYKDSKKEYYKYGYKYLIELLSEERKQEREKELEGIEVELAKYPEWKKIEQELLKSVER